MLLNVPVHPTAAPRARALGLRPIGDRSWAVIVFVATWLLRWLTLNFDNDDFMHMAFAAQILHGEWPHWHFFEPGVPLQTLLSYIALRLGGYQVAGEGIVATTSFAAAATFTYLACRRLGIPRALSLAVLLIAVGSFPRLYAYPKALVYPMAVWAIGRYAARPGRATLVGLAFVTALAFLLRHDHGVWVGVFVGLCLLALYGLKPRTLVRTASEYGGWTALIIAPWVVWTLFSGHAERYWTFVTGRGHAVVEIQQRPDTPFHFDWSAPMVTLAPIEYPRVHVRWAVEASPGERQERERRHGLQRIESGDNAYLLMNPARANVRALLIDPLVSDTAGIDRRSGQAPSGLFRHSYFQLQRFVPLVRLRVLPGLLTSANAQPWLASVTFFIPLIVLAVAALLVVRQWFREKRIDQTITAIVIPTALLSILTYQTLVRGSPDSRLGDVAGITAVQAAWLVGCVWSTRAPGWWLARSAAVMLLAVTILSALAFGRIVTRLEQAGVDGPTNLVRRARDVATQFGSRPLDVFAPVGAPGLPMLVRWVHACTSEQQRIAVAGFEPQIFFQAERGFAGGMSYYSNAWLSDPPDQQVTIERWRSQDVPVVLGMAREWDTFSADYEMIRAWIDEQYREVQRSTFGGGKEVIVLVSRSHTPTGEDAATGLPCFR